MRLPRIVAAVTTASLLLSVDGHSYDHRYTKGEHVELWVNKVRSAITLFTKVAVGHCRLSIRS
jgi:hypothetical protein